MSAWRARMISLALFGASLATACAVKAPVETEWVAAREGAEDLEAARHSCKERAVEDTKSVRAPGIGARAAGGIFMGCMREKGWELREKLEVHE